MAEWIIVLSGPVASGKTTLADALVERHGCVVFKTRQLIQRLVNTRTERRALQDAGDLLDRRTRGEWVAQALGQSLRDHPPSGAVIVDSLRKKSQIDALRNGFGPRVVHVHLTAPEATLSKRYGDRKGEVAELKSYASVLENSTERAVARLQSEADIVVETDRCTSEDVFVRVSSYLGFYGRSAERLVDVVVGGQYGSEGKGQIAAYLAPAYDILLRVGGPNAGHKVYEKPLPRTFHHLPSGTERTESRGARILLGPGAVLYVPGLLKEIADCQLDVNRLSIDPNALIIEEDDRRAELELVKTIGSTGQGVGQATARKILRTDAKPAVRLAKDHPDLRPYVRETRRILDQAFARGQRVQLEGTQGTGLSLHHGSYPHVTSRDTTVSGCLAEAGIAPIRVRRTVLVCRTYPIRVESPQGKTSGPMVNEITWKTVAERSGIPAEELEEKEKTSTTHKKRRVGEFDWALLRLSASLNAPTDVALTFTDYLTIKNRKARRFEQLGADTIRFIEEVERVASAPVSLIATRFHFRSIIDRRGWS